MVHLKAYDIIEWGFSISARSRRGQSLLYILDDKLDTGLGQSAVALREYLAAIEQSQYLSVYYRLAKCLYHIIDQSRLI